MKSLAHLLPYVVCVLVLLAGIAVLLRRQRQHADLVAEVRALREMPGPGGGDPLQVKKYRILRKLGSGGMAAVYLADGPKGLVALKIPDPHYFQTEEHRTFFNQELSVSRKMKHPNIVEILDHSDGTGDGLPYIAMEYIDGVTLDKRLPKKRPVPLEWACKILLEVTEALDYAHNIGGVVHRDIKPENIMLTRDGTVKVADFGIARDRRDKEHASEDSNAFVGSPHYMSPEQINSEDVDYLTDYYALGVVAFRLLTGYLPFEGENTMEVITRKVSQLPPPPSTYNPNLPLEVETLVRELMQREKERRPRSAVSIKKTLKRFVSPPKKRHGPRRPDAAAESDF